VGINLWSKLTLQTRAIIGIVGLLLLALTAMGLTNYLYGSNLALKKILAFTEEKIKSDAEIIQAKLRERRIDLQMLRDMPPVQGIIRSKEGGGRDPQTGNKLEYWYVRLEQLFEAFLTGHPDDLLRLRFIDEKGNELVHAVVVEKLVKTIPRERLQGQDKLPDVAGVLKLGMGEFHYSDIALLREQGKVAVPHLPVFTLSTPVYDGRNRILGAILMTIHARSLYADIATGADGTVKYLTNEEGYFLVHPDRDKEFGFDLGFNYTVRDRDQNAADVIKAQDYYIRYDKKQHHIDGMKKIFFDPGNNRRFLTILQEVPDNIALNDIYAMQASMIIVGFVIAFLAIVIILWINSREVLSPLSLLFSAAEKMEKGDLTVRLPQTGSAKEFLQVYRTLNAFAQKQGESIERFESDLALRVKELGSTGEKMKILSNAVEQSVESVVITDKDGNIDYVNPAFEIISGYSKAEAIGKNPRVLKSGRQSREFYKELWQTITDGGTWHGEFINKRKDGTLYNEEATISPIRNEIGVITHFVAIKNDVTIQKLAQETLMAKNEEISRQNELLVQANRTKSEFLSNMSHELRTPLNAIIGFSELLKDGVLGNLEESQKSYMTDIFDSGRHLLSLINEILDLSKIEEGKMTLDLEPVDIYLALESCLSVIRGKAAERNIETELILAADIGKVILDDRKFRQIILNLLSNAVKFTPDGGKVSIQANLARNRDTMRHRLPTSSMEGDLLEIAVTDTGIGMTAEDMKKLFKPFEQIDGSISRKYGGTGLGLAIVKKIAELHGGTVTVASEPAKGSVFTVLLPCRSIVQEILP